MRALAVAIIGLVVVSTEARADVGGNTGATVSTELVEKCPRIEHSEDKRREHAIEHYNRGAIYYEQGDYESAIDEFVAAYCEAPHPQMFFNIGQSFERLLDFETAVVYFERFLRESTPEAQFVKRAQVRVRVLRRLPARVRVATVPSGARVRVLRDKTLAASGRANAEKPLLVDGGSYTLEIESPDYQIVRQKVDLAIGQPYSYYFQLKRKKGVLRVHAEPASARIVINDRMVGLGSYSETVDIGRYEIRVEADKREPRTRKVLVSAGRTVERTIRLPKPKATGRWELVAAGGTMGLLTSSAAFAAASDEDNTSATAGLLYTGSLALGLGAGIIAVPKDIPIGRSSYIISSALIGGIELGAGAALFLCDTVGTGSEQQADCNDDAVFGAVTGGMLGGLAFGAVTASRFDLDAGDAAILNSGALWGTAVGLLFWDAFDNDPDLVEPLILAGLNLGVVSALTIAARAEVSRRRVALIDLSGIGGVIAGFAAAKAVDARDERIAHVTLVGTGAGLILGTLLTRFIDEDDRGSMMLTPATSAARDINGNKALTVGASMTF